MTALRHTDDRELWVFLAVLASSVTYNFLIKEISLHGWALICLALAVGYAHLDLYRLRGAIKILDQENQVLKNRSEWLLRDESDEDRHVADIWPPPLPDEEYRSPFWGE